MKKRLSYILLSGLFLSLFTTIAALGHAIDTEIEKSKVQLDATLSSLLELAAKENGNIKNKNIPIISSYNNEPLLFGTYEKRTFRTVDTTFTYQHKIVDMQTQTANNNQHFLLLTEQLNSKDIQIILDSILIDRKIDVRAAIGISSSGYPVKQLPWSGDTLSIHRNGCAQYTMTDDFTQIHYTAYLEYAPATIWAQMNKTFIWLWSIAVFVLSILSVYQIITNKKKQIEVIEEEEEPVEENIETEEKKELSIEKKYIIFGNNKVKASPQSIVILQRFLNAEKHRIAKDTLIELWAPKGDRANNMHSAISRINKLLHEIGCDLRIISDPEDANSYLLQ